MAAEIFAEIFPIAPPPLDFQSCGTRRSPEGPLIHETLYGTEKAVHLRVPSMPEYPLGGTERSPITVPGVVAVWSCAVAVRPLREGETLALDSGLDDDNLKDDVQNVRVGVLNQLLIASGRDDTTPEGLARYVVGASRNPNLSQKSLAELMDAEQRKHSVIIGETEFFSDSPSDSYGVTLEPPDDVASVHFKAMTVEPNSRIPMVTDLTPDTVHEIVSGAKRVLGWLAVHHKGDITLIGRSLIVSNPHPVLPVGVLHTAKAQRPKRVEEDLVRLVSEKLTRLAQAGSARPQDGEDAPAPDELHGGYASNADDEVSPDYAEYANLPAATPDVYPGFQGPSDHGQPKLGFTPIEDKKTRVLGGLGARVRRGNSK